VEVIILELFSARLKWLREKRGMSQREIASVIGMSAPGYGKIENGQREPNLETLVKLSKLFKERSDFLLGIVDLDFEGLRLFHTYTSFQDYHEAFHPSATTPFALQKRKEIREHHHDNYLRFYHYAKEIPLIPEDTLKKIEIKEYTAEEIDGMIDN
jgi:transcriptional regulator with XRE-family HTH domain